MSQPPANRVTSLARLTARRLALLAVTASEVALEPLGVPRPAALLILGHMRCGSTLLLHLLLTNPAITALGERNTTYVSSKDLNDLVALTRIKRGRFLSPLRYVADQINHNRFTPNHDLFTRRRVRTIILVRRPLDSLLSLMNLSRAFYGNSWTLSRAVDYYVGRLQCLGEIASAVAGSGKAAFVTYEDLTGSAARTLEVLRQFLGLDAAFSTQYAKQPFTGTRGDPGQKIGHGAVLPANTYDIGDVPAAHLDRASEAYWRCRQILDPLSLFPTRADHRSGPAIANRVE